MVASARSMRIQNNLLDDSAKSGSSLELIYTLGSPGLLVAPKLVDVNMLELFRSGLSVSENIKKCTSSRFIPGYNFHLSSICCRMLSWRVEST